MSVRTITDRSGVAWQVWEVIPGSPRTSGPPTGRMPNVWGGAAGPDVVPSAQGAVLDYEGGWLAFMSDTTRRRLAPIPPGWADLDDARLLQLLDTAG